MKTAAVAARQSHPTTTRTSAGLAALLRQPMATLTNARIDAVTRSALEGGLNTTKLKAANDYVGRTLKGVSNGPAHDAAQRGGTALQMLWWAMPRDFRAKGSGLTFDASAKLAADTDTPANLSVAVDGKATRAFNLTFTVGEAALSVAVPKGASGAQVAKLVAAAITQKADAITGSFDGKRTISDYGDNDDLNGIAATTRGNVVAIAPSYDS